MNRNLSLEQRIHNAEACQTVEEYKARHAYLHGPSSRATTSGRSAPGAAMPWPAT